MISVIVGNTARFIFLVLLQVLILNNIGLGGIINPYLYIIVTLSLPLDLPDWLTLTIGAILGLTIDLFTHTMGMHMSATLFLAFIRPILLKYIAPREGYEFGAKATIGDLGLMWYLTYATILILLHHAFLFFVESFTFNGFWYTMGKVVASSLFTLVLVLLFQYLGYKKKATD